MNWFILCLSLFYSFFSSANTGRISLCHHFLEENTVHINVTERLIAYFGELLKQQILTTKDLQKFVDSLQKQNQWINPFQVDSTATPSAKFYHAQAMQSYIRLAPSLDKEAFLAWAQWRLQRAHDERIKKHQMAKETEKPWIKMAFHRVEPGELIIQGQRLATLTTPIEVMETHVTQSMWVEITGRNPSVFKLHEPHIEYLSKFGDKINIQPDHPVTEITWWMAIQFANSLSIQHGLKPAYDLTAITDWREAPEFVNIYPQDEKAALKLIRINAPGNDIYKAEGYRLPTKAELVFLLTNRGTSPNEYFSEEVYNNMDDYAWYNSNSSGRLHAVAERKPFLIDGSPFFDLFGNLMTWTHDWDHDWKKPDPLLNGSVNPQTDYSCNEPQHSAQCGGGCYTRDHRNYSALWFCNMHKNSWYDHVGMRLVRSLSK